ncbi:hypothetical protein ACGFNQ_27745 [Streptomyces asoensis]|uniref:hypothetical protein n=1 Tax=Streptomyces asoensis TaxID=249586 RepID=UPI0037183E18
MATFDTVGVVAAATVTALPVDCAFIEARASSSGNFDDDALDFSSACADVTAPDSDSVLSATTSAVLSVLLRRVDLTVGYPPGLFEHDQLRRSTLQWTGFRASVAEPVHVEVPGMSETSGKLCESLASYCEDLPELITVRQLPGSAIVAAQPHLDQGVERRCACMQGKWGDRSCPGQLG